MIIASIVTHGQNAMAAPLIRSLLEYQEIDRVILTCNIPDDFNIPPHPKLHVIWNERKQGFAKNHNQAFEYAQQLNLKSEFFCVLNPDISIQENPFPRLLAHFERDGVALVAPAIVTPSGVREDNARVFPTLFGLALKAFGLSRGMFRDPEDGSPFEPDWVAGMFMLLRINDFASVHGFDDHYFLYYEDVDLCWRLKKCQKIVLCDPQIRVVHDARRASRRNVIYLNWHIQSALRFIVKSMFSIT